jgi:hypothetical protein
MAARARMRREIHWLTAPPCFGHVQERGTFAGRLVTTLICGPDGQPTICHECGGRVADD